MFVVSSPDDPRLSRIVEEATFVHELAELRFQDAVEFFCLAALHVLVVIKVNHLDGGGVF